MAASTQVLSPRSHTASLAAATVAPAAQPSAAAAAAASAASAARDAPGPAQPSPLKLALPTARDSVSPKSSRSVLVSPAHSPFSLTGAAARAEQREMRQKRAREEDDTSRQMSPNPGVTAVQTLLGNQLTSAKDAPLAVTKLSNPLEHVARSIKMPENGAPDSAQSSPISMSSLGSLDITTAPTAVALEVASAPPPLEGASLTADASRPPPRPPQQQQERDGDGEAKAAQSDTDGVRAFTFPPPRDQDPHHTPQRGMTMPIPFTHVQQQQQQQHHHHHQQQQPQQTTPQTRSPSISTGSGSSTKRHKCPYCNTDFTRHHNLKSHLLTHSQEKPYECKECNSRFRRLHDLKRHTKLHTGERPHTCPKCGRKFARGDALARHNKGAGGCAGRRSSFGAPGMGEDGQDGEHMDGLEYSQQETEEPDHMDDDMAEPGDRRKSEPSREVHHHRGATASTYPPIQGAPASVVQREMRTMYPPPPSGTASTQSSYRDPAVGPQPSQPSASSRAPGSINFPDTARQVFAQSGMTESPKPLSPGQDAHRSSISSSTAGSFPRPQHAPNTNPPTLPSLPGLSSHGPSGLHQSMPAPLGSGSTTGSQSSHDRSSGGSMREILGQHTGQDLFSMMRDVESSMARMKNDYEAQISNLKQEVSMLREHLRQHQLPAPPPS